MHWINQRTTKNVLACSALSFLLLQFGIQEANSQSVIDRYNHVLRDAQSISPLDADLFGDQTSSHDGTTTFSITDVVLPTNGSIPVALGRKFEASGQFSDQQGRTTAYTSTQFGQFWDLDVPYMKGTFDAIRGWVGQDPNNPQRVASGSPKRCTWMGNGPPPTMGIGYFSSVEYAPQSFFSGITISIPGVGTEQVLKQTPRTINGTVYGARTKSNWQIGCLPSIANGTGEGFEVLLPNGTKYRFNWAYRRMASSVIDSNCGTNNMGAMPSYDIVVAVPWAPQINAGGCTASEAIPRTEDFLYATEVTDRFGNTVSYDYETVARTFPYTINAQGFRLTQIRSSDGATIALSYNADNRIQSVTANGRVWQYVYGTTPNFGGSELTALKEVILPGSNGKWTYTYGNNLVTINKFDPLIVWAGCQVNIGTKKSSVTPGSGETNTLTMTHPSGASGTFEFRKIMHGTRQSEPLCFMWVNASLYPGVGPTSIIPVMHDPSAYQAASLYKKTISGPGIATQQWNFFYEPGWNTPYESVTTVTDSAGKMTTYTYGNECSYHCTTQGLLLQTTEGSTSATLRVTKNHYVLSAAGQNYTDTVGELLYYGGDRYGGRAFNYNRPLYKTVIVQDGVTFSSTVNTGCVLAAAYCFDSRVRPTSFTKSSAPAP